MGVGERGTPAKAALHSVLLCNDSKSVTLHAQYLILTTKHYFMKSERELQHRMKMQIGNTFVNVSLQELVAHFLLPLWKKKKKI